MTKSIYSRRNFEDMISEVMTEVADSTARPVKATAAETATIIDLVEQLASVVDGIIKRHMEEYEHCPEECMAEESPKISLILASGKKISLEEYEERTKKMAKEDAAFGEILNRNRED